MNANELQTLSLDEKVFLTYQRKNYVLDILVKDPSPYVRKHVAQQRRDKDSDILVSDPDPTVRAEVGRGGRLKDIKILMYDPEDEVRFEVMLFLESQFDNLKQEFFTKYPQQVVEVMVDQAIDNIAFYRGVVLYYADKGNQGQQLIYTVCQYLLKKTGVSAINAKIDILKATSHPIPNAIFAKDSSWQVRAEVAKKAQKSILLYLCNDSVWWIRMEVAKRGEEVTFEVLYKDEVEMVRAAVAQGASNEYLDVLREDPSWIVRRTVASRRRKEDLDVLRNDSSWGVRWEVAQAYRDEDLPILVKSGLFEGVTNASEIIAYLAYCPDHLKYSEVMKASIKKVLDTMHMDSVTSIELKALYKF